MGLVTDGSNSKYPNSKVKLYIFLIYQNNKVFIWDKYNKELKTEYKHASRVEMISLTQKHLFVLTYNNVYIFLLYVILTLGFEI